MATRKYRTETILSFFTSDVVLVPPDQLHVPERKIPANLKRRLKHCHIYIIGRRAALSFDPGDFSWDGEYARGKLLRKVGGVTNSSDYKFRLGLAAAGEIKVGAYPHRTLIEVGAEGEVVSTWPAAFVMRADLNDRSFVDLEVVYVGMAYGKGDRSALDRLRKHETLQQILAETAATRPDDEVMVLMFKYEGPSLHAGMDGRANVEVDGDDDHEHFMSLIDNPISERQKIGLVEAGLIRYFRPYYNEKFKEKFPVFGQKVLDECYKLDFIGLSLEVNTEELPLRIWSKSQPAGHHHIAHFDLHDSSERRHFFSYLDTDDDDAPRSISGPIF